MPWPKGVHHTAEMIASRTKALTESGIRHKQSTEVDGQTAWLCPKCLTLKLSGDFYKDKRSPNGLKSQCKKCHTSTSIATRDKDLARYRNREYARSSRRSNPEKVRNIERERSRHRVRTERDNARQILNGAVRTGKVVKPVSCSDCGAIGKITGHHEDYNRPLDVVWLCYECHGLRHRLRP